ncbi:MAG: IS982 family transposase [Chloroflexi bacterium]|uniref:IS982 family transposase n=1 Tax=Candidatus Chlorohelix allophototropha TaxID=3003348 RepID=A0A8T7LYS3_9CHLR|nr:IS982 family transposase [Chloroflexota bacterium]WJW67336.1 IS982 family transposase [Chloroflexota bacterium L227-S17]WJW69555.1 IS982 family transposase [Chloroflexota bacterium L227-S17]
MITNFEDFCTWAFVIIDDLWKELSPAFTRTGPQPACSDSELITLAVVGECKGWDQETELISNWRNYQYLFPHIPERSRFNRRRRNLMGAINSIRQSLLALLDLAQDQQTVLDSLPLPVIEFRQAHFSPARSYWSSQGARYGKVATKKQTIFGYKLQLLVTFNGVIVDFELAGANQPDLRVGLELLENHPGLTVVGDKAYISQSEQQHLEQEQGIKLLTNPRQNQKVEQPAERAKLINHFRQIIETVNGQLAQQFKLEINRAHSFWGLCSRLYSKLAGHTLSIYLNRLLGKPDCLKIKALAFPI